MNAKILTLTNTEQGTVTLPSQFHEPIRSDLISRAVRSILCNARQPYGNHPGAGQRQSAKLSRRRRDFKGAYGMGISRVPRKTLSRNGTRMNWVGAVAPGTVKGRQAHPPTSRKLWEVKINAKENRKAIRSAMAASMDKSAVLQRGHHAPAMYPFILDTSAEQLHKTKDLVKALQALGLSKELERGAQSKICTGRSATRGRRVRNPRSILIVVSKACGLSDAGHNISGVEVCPVMSLNAELLAPGGVPGRLTLYTAAAIEHLAKNKLFA